MMKIFNILFGYDPHKCRLMYDLYLCQVSIQMTEAVSNDDRYTSPAEINKRLEKYHVSAFLPFIYFMVLMTKGNISKREMLAVFSIMCVKSFQPLSLINRVFQEIHHTTPNDTLKDTLTDNWTKKHALYVKHGPFPIIVAAYHKVIFGSGNVFSEMLLAADEFEAREPKASE